MYKLILLDYSMPECDGPTATVEIRRLLGEDQKAPIQPFICCVTAYTGESFKQAALQYGMNDFLTKPISKDALEDLLGQVGLIQCEN